MVRSIIGSVLLFLAAGATASADVEPHALIQTTDIDSLSVSPDARWLAFRTRQADIGNNGYRLTWHVAPTDLSMPVRIVADGGVPLWTDAGGATAAPPQWLPGSDGFVFRALIDGAVGLWRASPSSFGRVAVAIGDADVRSYDVDPVSGRITYTIGASRAAIMAAEDREYRDGIVVDATVDMAQSVYHGAIVNGRHATQRLAGRWFARQGLLAETPDRVIVIEPKKPLSRGSSLSTMAAPSADAASTGEPSILTPDKGGRCLSVSNHPGSAGSDPPAIRRCFPDRIAASTWWPDRKSLLVTLQDEGFAQTLVDWSPRDNRITALVRSSGLVAGSEVPSSPCALTASAAFCVMASAGVAPRLMRIDRRTGRGAILYAPNGAVMRNFAGTVTRLDWRDGAGARFTGQLVAPRRARHAPLFVTYYRCPGFVRGGLGDEWPLAAFADAGIAALCINKPPGPEGETLAQPGYDRALSGVTAIIGQLARDGTIDPTRVGMGGLSLGSEVTMWTAMRSTVLRAVSIASLQLEAAYFWMNGVRGRDNHAQLATTWGLGAPDETPEQWRRMSPALNIDRIATPVLLQLPEQEARTSMEFYARLTHSSTPAELYVFPDEPHILIQPAHRLAAYRRNIDWFRFWLQDRVDPDPDKARQYQRWQTLAIRWKPAQSSHARAQSSTPTRSNRR